MQAWLSMGEHPHRPGAYRGAFQTLMCLCITWGLVNCRSDSVVLVWGLVLCPLKLQVQLPLMELEGVGWARWGLSPSSPRILFPPGELHFISLTSQAYSWPLRERVHTVLTDPQVALREDFCHALGLWPWPSCLCLSGPSGIQTITDGQVIF